MVETMLRSNLFFSPEAYRRRIKSPVEFALGIVKGMEAMVSTTQLAQDLAGLGQNLYHPPTVRGWTGGKGWINDATMIRRLNLVADMLAGSGPYKDRLDPWRLAVRHNHSTVDSATRFALDLFLQGDISTDTQGALMATGAKDAKPGEIMRQRVHAILTLPEFQLA